MGNVVIECPSGLSVEVRGLEVTECNDLVDQEVNKAGLIFDSVLSKCTTRIVDPGPYKFDTAVDWAEVYVGDRLAAIIDIRRATYHRPYEFRIPCSTCKEPIDWKIELADLPRRKLPEASRVALQGDRIITAKWPEVGKEVKFRLLLGKDGTKARKLTKQHPKELVYVSLLSRVVEVEGVSPAGLDAFLAHLGAEPMLDLLDLFDEHEGGVDTTIEVVCRNPECGITQETELPFGRSFWLPRRRKALARGI